MNFCTIQNLPCCTRKPLSPFDLSPTLLPIGDGKKCILGLTSYNNQVSLTTKIWRNVGEVHSPGYPAEVRADIWHPALTEAHLQGKGLFSMKFLIPSMLWKTFQVNCKFFINKNMIFHELTHNLTWIHCRCLQTVQTSQDPYPEVGADPSRTCTCRRTPLPPVLEDSFLSAWNLPHVIPTNWWA